MVSEVSHASGRSCGCSADRDTGAGADMWSSPGAEPLACRWAGTWAGRLGRPTGQLRVVGGRPSWMDATLTKEAGKGLCVGNGPGPGHRPLFLVQSLRTWLLSERLPLPGTLASEACAFVRRYYEILRTSCPSPELQCLRLHSPLVTAVHVDTCGSEFFTFLCRLVFHCLQVSWKPFLLS